MGSSNWVASLRDRRFLLGVLLVAATLVLYLQVLHHPFIPGWDDDAYVTDNTHVLGGLNFENVGWALTAIEPFYWHPLTWISHMLDCQWFGLNAGAHHYVNVVLHAVNVLLLFWLLYRGTGSLWRSFIAAGLFALHPLNVQTVAWVAARKSLLSLLFTLLTVAAYARYAKRPDWKRYSLVLALFVMALMSRPMSVTLPAGLLLLDIWPLRRYEDRAFSKRWIQLLKEKLPLFMIGFGISAITIFSESAAGTVVPFSVLPLSTRIQNALISVVAYLGKVIWPSNLAVFYPHPASVGGHSLPMGDVIASTIVLAGITGIIIHFRKTGYLVFGWLFFLVTLLPMMGIIQAGYQGRQDHFLYIPCIGLFIALAWSAHGIAGKKSVKRAVPLFASLVVLISYSLVAYNYLRCWESPVKLFEQARSAVGKPDPWLEQLLANALLKAGQEDRALEHYQESCRLGPRNEYCHFGIAEILLRRGQLRQAVEELHATLSLTRNRDVALVCMNKLSGAFMQMGDYTQAQQWVSQALAVDPQNGEALRLRGEILKRKSREY